MLFIITLSITFGKPLRMGLIPKENNQVVRGLEFSAPPHTPSYLLNGGGRNSEWLNHHWPKIWSTMPVYIEAATENPKIVGFRELHVCEQVWHTHNCTGTEAHVLRTLPDLTLCVSSPDCLFVFFNIFVIINR